MQQLMIGCCHGQLTLSVREDKQILPPQNTHSETMGQSCECRLVPSEAARLSFAFASDMRSVVSQFMNLFVKRDDAASIGNLRDP